MSRFAICDYFYCQNILTDASCLSESLRFESSNGFVQDQGTLPELSVSIVSTLILPLCPVPSRHRPCLGRPSSPSLLISETLAADAPASREGLSSVVQKEDTLVRPPPLPPHRSIGPPHHHRHPHLPWSPDHGEGKSSSSSPAPGTRPTGPVRACRGPRPPPSSGRSPPLFFGTICHILNLPINH